MFVSIIQFHHVDICEHSKVPSCWFCGHRIASQLRIMNVMESKAYSSAAIFINVLPVWFVSWLNMVHMLIVRDGCMRSCTRQQDMSLWYTLHPLSVISRARLIADDILRASIFASSQKHGMSVCDFVNLTTVLSLARLIFCRLTWGRSIVEGVLKAKIKALTLRVSCLEIDWLWHVPCEQGLMRVLDNKACRSAVMFGDRLTRPQVWATLKL